MVVYSLICIGFLYVFWLYYWLCLGEKLNK